MPKRPLDGLDEKGYCRNLSGLSDLILKISKYLGPQRHRPRKNVSLRLRSDRCSTYI